MSEHLIRVGNLKALQSQHHWDDSELARQCGRTPQQVHAWFKGNRKIGEKLARDLEDQLGLQRFALDDRAAILKVEEVPPTWGNVRAIRASVKNKPRELPVYTWANAGDMFDTEPKSGRPLRTLATLAPTSHRACFVEMPDDSMEPVFASGDHVLFDPEEPPRAGDVVLVRSDSGEQFVRVYRPRTASQFEATSLNPNYQPLSSHVDGLKVVAVMVEHRRYRRGP
jgi:SOS-response transcriptional repressor LexA